MSERQPPCIDVYDDAAMRLDMYGDKWIPTFLHGFMPQGISAKQAREAAHLLNQLAEYLEWHARQHSKSSPERAGNA